MPTKELEFKKTPQADPDAWISTIFPALTTYWADYIASFAATQPTPDFNNWLTLVHAAAAAPNNLPRHLTQFLSFGQNSNVPINEWQVLSDLLALTFEAAKSGADKLNSHDWQNLFEIQTRILKTAAQLSANTQTTASNLNASDFSSRL